MMSQVARANTQVAGGDPRSLKRLSVQFRGMGLPEQELMVTGTVKSADDGTRRGGHRRRPGRQPGDPQRRGGAGLALSCGSRRERQGRAKALMPQR